MGTEITFKLSEKEVIDAVTEYVKNISGQVTDKMKVYSCEFDGKSIEITFKDN